MKAGTPGCEGGVQHGYCGVNRGVYGRVYGRGIGGRPNSRLLRRLPRMHLQLEFSRNGVVNVNATDGDVVVPEKFGLGVPEDGRRGRGGEGGGGGEEGEEGEEEEEEHGVTVEYGKAFSVLRSRILFACVELPVLR